MQDIQKREYPAFVLFYKFFMFRVIIALLCILSGFPDKLLFE